MFQLFIALLMTTPPTASANPGPLVHALWLVHSQGRDDIQVGTGDQRIKASLAKALSGDGTISFSEVKDLFNEKQFQAMANQQSQLSAEQLKMMAEAAVPASRKELYPQLASHLDYLTTTFDMIDESHHASADQLTRWIVSRYQDEEELHVTVVCTGNSRRSILTACMGNAAAAYYGLTKLRFHSGGTAPSAFNSRTIHALTEIGFKITASGKEAPRGDAKTANPIYSVSWGHGFECQEFSKVYSDPANPQSGFAAILVCSEADSDCPTVKGASARIAMPFLDPKIYDGSTFETAKYAERRDDIARTILMAVCQAQRQLASSHQ